MAASPGFSVFFFGSFSNTRQPRNSTLVCYVLGRLQRRISVYADCTPDEPARVVKPHRKHAQNTTGEVRGEFQLRRVRAFAALETTPRYVNVRVVFFARLIRNLRSILVGMTIRVGCHAQNERAPTISSCVKSGGTVTRRWSTLV